MKRLALYFKGRNLKVSNGNYTNNARIIRSIPNWQALVTLIYKQMINKG